MKAFLWWFTICALILLAALGIKALPDNLKGFGIIAGFACLNGSIFWLINRRS